MSKLYRVQSTNVNSTRTGYFGHFRTDILQFKFGQKKIAKLFRKPEKIIEKAKGYFGHFMTFSCDGFQMGSLQATAQLPT